MITNTCTRLEAQALRRIKSARRIRVKIAAGQKLHDLYWSNLKEAQLVLQHASALMLRVHPPDVSISSWPEPNTSDLMLLEAMATEYILEARNIREVGKVNFSGGYRTRLLQAHAALIAAVKAAPSNE